MPLILRQLLGSEKFVYSLLYMIPISIFTALGLMTIGEWRNDALWALGILTGGKTLQGIASTLVSRPLAPAGDQAAVTSVIVNPPQVPPPVDSATRPMSTDELDAALKRQAHEPPPPIRPGE